MPVFVLRSPTDTIVFTGSDIDGGYVYDNDALSAWYQLATPRFDLHQRPNAPGAYDLDQTNPEEARPELIGQYFGSSPADATSARNRLTKMYNEGRVLTLEVTDELGTTTRRVWMTDCKTPWTPFSHFRFSIGFVAPDPRRYGTEYVDATGMPSGSSGLVWDLGTSPSGLYFDWGTDGNLGQVPYTNTGGAATYPVLEVGGNGSFAGGFRVTEIETGKELTYARATNTGDFIVLNNRTRRATLNGGDVTGGLTKRQWFEVPPGASRRYQINPLGAVNGVPILRLRAAAAYL
jgi:hypothetical protein